VPIQLIQALRHHRTMIPVPATYLATLVGVVVGVAAQLLLGWPWWLVAAGVVAAVWLFFTSTAVWGPGGSSQPLATDLLRVVHPRQAIEREHRQEVERFQAAPFPLYGLPPVWPGPRHLGGWEGSWARRQRPSLLRSASATATRWWRRGRSCGWKSGSSVWNPGWG